MQSLVIQDKTAMGAKIISSHFNVLPSLEHGWQKAGTHLNREQGGGGQMRAGEGKRERGAHFRESRVVIQ